MFTFDLGALNTVKLPAPALDNAGLRVVAFVVLATAGFFVTEDACDEVVVDWLWLSPVFFGRRNEGRDGRTPP